MRKSGDGSRGVFEVGGRKANKDRKNKITLGKPLYQSMCQKSLTHFAK